MNLREVQDTKIRQLAQTLKNNGLAASETEAIRMATSMVSTEKKVNDTFETRRDEILANRQRQTEERRAANRPSSQPWEKEVFAQEQAASGQPPAPHHGNQALNAAISHVQQQFSAPQQHVNLGVNQEQATLAATVQEEPFFEQEQAPVAQEESQPTRPRVVEQPLPAPQAMADEEEDIPERTQEIHDRPQRKNLGSYEESKVDLANVFNFSKR